MTISMQGCSCKDDPQPVILPVPAWKDQASWSEDEREKKERSSKTRHFSTSATCMLIIMLWVPPKKTTKVLR